MKVCNITEANGACWVVHATQARRADRAFWALLVSGRSAARPLDLGFYAPSLRAVYVALGVSIELSTAVELGIVDTIPAFAAYRATNMAANELRPYSCTQTRSVLIGRRYYSQREAARHVIDGYNVEFQGARPAKAGQDY